MNCRVCGRQFDPSGFQVVVPGLGTGFDRVECALEASELGLPPAVRTAPVATVVRSLPPLAPLPAFGRAPAATTAEAVRPPLLVGTNLALLAAGAVATIYLWLRVFGADLSPFPFPAESASPAFGRTTVPAAIDLSPAVTTRPQPERAVNSGQPAAVPLGELASVSSGEDAGTNGSNGSQPRTSRGSGPVVRPSPPPPPPEPPAEPEPPRSAPVPTFPVPSTPPGDRVPGPTLPGGPNPEEPTLPGSGTRSGG